MSQEAMSISEMAAAVGMTTHALRYYEKAGLIEPVARTGGNHRTYSSEDIEWVRFLQRLKETNMSIQQMREYARLRALGAETLPQRMALLVAHQEWLDRNIALLQAHRQALHAKIELHTDLLPEREIHNDNPK